MIQKTVKVVKHRIETYVVEGNEDPITDNAAIDIVKMRMQAGMPLGLIKEEDALLRFEVGDNHYDPDGQPEKQETK
jgi:hypothetical protein